MDISVFNEEVIRQFPEYYGSCSRKIECDFANDISISVWVNLNLIEIDYEFDCNSGNGDIHCRDLYYGSDVRRAAAILFGLTNNSVWLEYIR